MEKSSLWPQREEGLHQAGQPGKAGGGGVAQSGTRGVPLAPGEDVEQRPESETPDGACTSQPLIIPPLRPRGSLVTNNNNTIALTAKDKFNITRRQLFSQSRKLSWEVQYCALTFTSGILSSVARRLQFQPNKGTPT